VSANDIERQTSDNTALHSKILGFIAGELTRKELRLCIGIDLLYAPGNGFRDEEIRKWNRANEPEMFDFALVHGFVGQIIDIATDEVESKASGKHRFVVRTRQYASDRRSLSFALSSSGDAMADVPPSRCACAVELRTILAQQHDTLRAELSAARKENRSLRDALDEVRAHEKRTPSRRSPKRQSTVRRRVATADR
jgi:hypothetical protein